MAAIVHSFYFRFIRSGNQDGKDLARRIIINGKSINSIYNAPTAKDGKTYDFIDSDEKR